MNPPDDNYQAFDQDLSELPKSDVKHETPKALEVELGNGHVLKPFAETADSTPPQPAPRSVQPAVHATEDIFDVPTGSPEPSAQMMSLRSRTVKDLKNTRVGQGKNAAPAKQPAKAAKKGTNADSVRLDQSTPSKNYLPKTNSGKKRSPTTYSTKSRATTRKANPRSKVNNAKATTSDGPSKQLPSKNQRPTVKGLTKGNVPAEATRESPAKSPLVDDIDHAEDNVLQPLATDEGLVTDELMVDAPDVPNCRPSSLVEISSDHSYHNSIRESSEGGVQSVKIVAKEKPEPAYRPEVTDAAQPKTKSSIAKPDIADSLQEPIQIEKNREPRNGSSPLVATGLSCQNQRKRKASDTGDGPNKQPKLNAPPEVHISDEDTYVVSETPVNYQSLKENTDRLFTIYEDCPTELMTTESAAGQDNVPKRMVASSFPEPLPARDMPSLVGELGSPIQSKARVGTAPSTFQGKWIPIRTPLQDIPTEIRRFPQVERAPPPNDLLGTVNKLPWRAPQPKHSTANRRETASATEKLTYTLYGLVDVSHRKSQSN